MKRVLIIILMTLVVSSLSAQNFTKSYSCVSVATSMGPQAPPASLATWIEFYDDYIMVMGMERFRYGGRNPDGSLKYWATKQGMPALNTIGWVVSSNYSSVKQVVQSTMGGMTMQMEYDYNYIGEGEYAAQSMMGGADSGGWDSDDEPLTCQTCYGSGACKYCNGSGRDPYMRDGRCGVCRGTRRCSGCNGKGTY